MNKPGGPRSILGTVAELYDTRRYLTNFDSRRVPHILTDVLVIGSGAAGLRAAVEAAQHANVIVVTKAAAQESNTYDAQGGIAVAIGPRDTTESHVDDTLRVACGLGDRQAIELMVRQGPERIEELIEWGATFDTDTQKDQGRTGTGSARAHTLALAREGGHSAARIVHALGDATGKEVATTLLRVARQTERIRMFENCFVIDLITIEGNCVGAITFHEKYGHQLIWARQTILASGGCGQVYRETTNPALATADGHAMAYRAGAVLRDMEMVQFHPTTLYVAGASRALISEAVRGEGARLVDRQGNRFMPDYHPDAELAPRDVVSRAILDHMVRTGATCVYLDVRHIAEEHFKRRFPSITQLCAAFDIDVSKDLIPVRPSAHYMVGGAQTDLDARTSVRGLLACGEVASTGVHGANRLASNSLLEGLVFGAIAGQTAGRDLHAGGAAQLPLDVRSQIAPSDRTVLDLTDVRNSLRALCWRNTGIERNGDRLAETIHIIEFWGHYVMDKVFDDQFGWETQNMLTVARLTAFAAGRRTESRGVHYRSDYPQTDDRNWRRHLMLRRSDAGIQPETASPS